MPKPSAPINRFRARDDGTIFAVAHTSLTEDPNKETVYWHYKQIDQASGVFTLRTTLDPEIGVRMALGARGDDIVRLILKQGGRLIVLGLALGFGAALVLGRAMASQIYEVSATDPAVYAIALARPSIAALLASWLPARCASRIHPMNALRQE